MSLDKRTIPPSCRLDVANECLWRGANAIKLRPKAFALLNYLLDRPGQLVTKEELLSALWPETFVGEAVLKVTIRQLREALEDDSKSPRFIETAHRRGYRFIGQLAEGGHLVARDQDLASQIPGLTQSQNDADSLPGVVGREKALAQMQTWLENALAGERQIGFVTGEAGIGKTALVDTFARTITIDRAFGRNILIGRGQCLEQYGTSEAYLPVLEAIGQLCRQRAEVIDVLRSQAPMWLLQMPSLVSATDRELLSREVLGATRERMLREMSDALEALTAASPLVLILEDLHWSDYSTLDLISYLARQRHPARLMVVGTYRTAELIVSGHPLRAVKQELLAKQQCDEMPLEYLSADDVAKYLFARFHHHQFPPELATLIHERTDGNPLFMVNAVDYLLAEGLIDERGGVWELVVEIANFRMGVPDSVKQIIEKQLDHLDSEQQRTLEAASVAGAEFSALAVVAGLGDDRAVIEARCDELARQHRFLQDCGLQELPNGDAAIRYGFIHALYQNVLYERMSPARRIQLHRQIAAQGEVVYGDRAVEIAAELAMHFERGSNYKQAVKYLQQAAENGIRRFAYRQAVGLARRGLELLATLPDTRERAEQELRLHLTLGVPLIATEGYGAPDVGSAYMRARELCRQLGDTPEIAQVLWGLWTFHTLRAELGTAREIAEELLRLAARLPYQGLALRGHWAMQITFMHLGEFAPSMKHFERGLSLYDHERHRDDAFRYAQNPGVAMRCFAAWVLWFLGRPDQALNRINEALRMARELSEPHVLAHALFFAAVVHQLRREVTLAQEHAEAALDVSTEHELVLYQAMATLVRGWALFEQGLKEEGLKLIRDGLAAHRATGTDLLVPHFLALLAEALASSGDTEEGLRLSDEALELAASKGERYYEAEIYRVKGKLLLGRGTDRRLSQSAAGGMAFEKAPPDLSQAEQYLHRAAGTARRQNAQSLELRSAISLARLYQTQGRNREALELLGPAFDGFTEGFDTLDLKEAKALLSELK